MTRYGLELAAALRRRGLPDDIGAAMRSGRCWHFTHPERLALLRRIHEAQLEANRIAMSVVS